MGGECPPEKVTGCSLLDTQSLRSLPINWRGRAWAGLNNGRRARSRDVRLALAPRATRQICPVGWLAHTQLGSAGGALTRQNQSTAGFIGPSLRAKMTSVPVRLVAVVLLVVVEPVATSRVTTRASASAHCCLPHNTALRRLTLRRDFCCTTLFPREEYPW